MDPTHINNKRSSDLICVYVRTHMHAYAKAPPIYVYLSLVSGRSYLDGFSRFCLGACALEMNSNFPPDSDSRKAKKFEKSLLYMFISLIFVSLKSLSLLSFDVNICNYSTPNGKGLMTPSHHLLAA